ncbi:hypothetical protein QJS04_geneDACA000056 [Acorus gramineus]|uniref:L-ascorbate oxidase n=1 Tax=Acorus gramineus TaxID=55184 RepID=A0AAV9ARI9_ACOGR|nr:hypothetical protein QJS04_geneDACA000056 [Acorus gramineus]
MSMPLAAAAVVLLLSLGAARAEDPYLFFTWNVTYGTISPLGVPQQGILINGQFPGPNINSTTNNNIVINVFNNLDQPLLFSWNGIQQHQIGSYFYFPSTAMHKAAGGFGGLRVNSRLLIPVPYPDPADDYTVLIGDWYSKSHTTLKHLLDSGRSLGRPDGVLLNGKTKSSSPLFNMEAGKAYHYRICNVGMKNSLNFRIQGHAMKLVEMDGSHTVQNIYDSLDVHVGQCYSVIVTADQEPRDYVMIASTRFTKYNLSATGVIRYAGSNKPPLSELPEAPVGWGWSLNQFRSFRWNLTASAARPNPQGSYHYGQINITRTIKLANSAGTVDGKLRYALNGASFSDPDTPLKLAEYFGAADKVFMYNTVGDVPPKNVLKAPVVVGPVVLTATFRDFIEVVFENHEKSIQSYHLDGYSFFPVGMGPGVWTAESRKNYNMLDAVSRHTIQVYPKSWSAILLTFDNAGMWNLRSENWERHYLGQQLYISVVSPARSLRDEYNIPDNQPLCGIVTNLPKPPPYT